MFSPHFLDHQRPSNTSCERFQGYKWIQPYPFDARSFCYVYVTKKRSRGTTFWEYWFIPARINTAELIINTKNKPQRWVFFDSRLPTPPTCGHSMHHFGYFQLLRYAYSSWKRAKNTRKMTRFQDEYVIFSSWKISKFRFPTNEK